MILGHLRSAENVLLDEKIERLRSCDRPLRAWEANWEHLGHQRGPQAATVPGGRGVLGRWAVGRPSGSGVTFRGARTN